VRLGYGCARPSSASGAARGQQWPLPGAGLPPHGHLDRGPGWRRRDQLV